MQLDKTHVVIRLRTLSEIGDLALVLLRNYPGALLIGFALGALPWIICNTALLCWIPMYESEYNFYEDEEAFYEMARYAFWMILLVFMQTPIAGVLTTKYMGHAVFEEKPTWSSVISEVRQHFWRWFYALGIKRMVVPTMILLLLRWDSPSNWFYDVVVPVLLLLFSVTVRSSRPFIPEILLLEQCPISSSNANVITAARRSRTLHTPMGSELNGRFLALSLIFGWLFLSVFYTLFATKSFLSGYDHLGLFSILVLFPLSLWIVAGASVLVRLINYLDTRIRLEGWEVELAVRAEAIRQFGQDATQDRPRHAENAGTKNAGVKQPPEQSPGSATTQADQPAGATT